MTTAEEEVISALSTGGGLGTSPGTIGGKINAQALYACMQPPPPPPPPPQHKHSILDKRNKATSIPHENTLTITYSLDQ